MYPNINDPELQQNIFKKKEFIELLDNKKINYKYQILDKYQEFIRRFISPYTYYDRILLFHSTGTGKSFSAISVAETHKEYKYKCLVLVKGKTSELNFKNLINEFNNKLDLKNCKNDKYYEFDRFIKFSKKLSSKTNNEIIRQYSNKIIIIDEAHNIKSEYLKNSENKNIYKNIYNMLHIIKNTKVLFLTATPMVDSCNEMFPLLNLILDKESKIMPNEYENENIIKKRINGIISYCDIKYNIPEVEIKGINLPTLKFKVYVSFMKGYQKKAWEHLNMRIKKSGENTNIKYKIERDPVHRSRIYCSTIVSKTRKYGNKILNECINEISINNHGKKFILKNNVNINLENIEDYSCKFASMIKISLLCNGCIYVFCEDIEGSGLKMLSAILENIGYSMFTSWNKDITKGKRFILCTGDESITPKIDYLIENFCKDENKTGEYIKFFLGSRVVSESINLKNIRQVHILTPHWNLPVINQAIGRSIRNFSHNSLDKHMRKVEIFLHCAIYINNNININTLFNGEKTYENSVDYYKYNCAQKKYNKIKKIINILKDNSINRFLGHKQIKQNNIDYFTYRAFYADSLSNCIVDLIKKEIENTGYNSILKSLIITKLNVNSEIIDDILHKKIINKIIIKDKYSQQYKKILYNDGVIYLNKCTSKDSDINMHLIKYNIKNSNIILKNDILNISLKLNDKQLNILKYNIINLEFINKMFNLNIKELVELLEYGIIYKVDILNEYFNSFLIYNNNILYHNLCYFDLNDKICSYSISSGNYNISRKTRKYIKNEKKWEYVEDYNLEILLKNENKNMLKEITSLKVYLLISNADKCFRLCNKITENISMSKNDNRSRNRGKRLESYTPKELNDIFIYLSKKISYLDFLNLKSVEKIKKNGILSKLILQEIIKYILFKNKMYLIH